MTFWGGGPGCGEPWAQLASCRASRSFPASSRDAPRASRDQPSFRRTWCESSRYWSGGGPVSRPISWLAALEPSRARRGLGELLSRGLVTNDRFDPLRAGSQDALLALSAARSARTAGLAIAGDRGGAIGSTRGSVVATGLCRGPSIREAHLPRLGRGPGGERVWRARRGG